MSLLDKNLVDQKSIDEHFKEMLYELYERLMNGTLCVDEIEKNPFTERGMCGLMWRFRCDQSDVSKGYRLILSIGSVVYEVSQFEVKDEETLQMLNKEYVKDSMNKLLDLYWDKSIHEFFNFEVSKDGGNEWVRVGIPISLHDVLLWRIRCVKSRFRFIKHDLKGKIAPREYKEILNWLDQ